jgi:hypothetical protein
MQKRSRACGHDFKRGAIRAARATGRSQSRGLRNPILHFCARHNWLCYGAAQNGWFTHPVRLAQCPTRARYGSRTRGTERCSSRDCGRQRRLRLDLKFRGRVVGGWCSWTATPTIGRCREEEAIRGSKDHTLSFTELELIG